MLIECKQCGKKFELQQSEIDFYKSKNLSLPKRLFIMAISLILLLCVFTVLVLNKKIQPNQLFCKKYPVKGVDVSHYQGDIDWEILKTRGISFTYIKATEGSTSVDEKFADNWLGVGKTDLCFGAYHFFSFDSAGTAQAEHYISTVGDLNGCLIPVVDVEFYGDKSKNPPLKEDVVRELSDFLDVLEQEYRVKPMIYCTNAAYQKYIKGSFDEYPLWIRNVYFSPELLIRGDWELWQYSDTAVLDGYSGEEKYIDMNVFRGNIEDLRIVGQ